MTAASFAKLARTSRSPISASKASTARSPSARGSSPRAWASGSTIQSSRNTPGMSTKAIRATRPTTVGTRGDRVGREVPGRADRQPEAERQGAGPAQYGGSSAHQEPSALNAFQNAVFAGASSSEASMSGTDERLDRRREPLQLAELGLDRLPERELEVVQERERVLAHDDDELRLDDVQLPGQPPACLLVVGAFRELDAVRPVDRHRVDVQPLERLQHRLARPAEERDALLHLRRLRPVLEQEDVRERVTGARAPGSRAPPAARAISSPSSLISEIAFCRYFSWISSAGTAVTGARSYSPLADLFLGLGRPLQDLLDEQRLRPPQDLGSAQADQELLGAVERAHPDRAGADAEQHVRVGAGAHRQVVLAGEAQRLVVERLKQQARVVDLEHVDVGEVPV